VLPLDEHAVHLLTWLRRKAGPTGRRLRSLGLSERATVELGLDPVSIYSAFAALRASGAVDYRPDPLGIPFTGFVTMTSEVVEMSATARGWGQALQTAAVEPELAQALAASHRVVEGLDEQDMSLLIEGLLRLRLTDRSPRAEFGFELSARELLGSSKILGRLPQAALRLLGVDQLPGTPRYVVVAGPAEPSGVLLIENTTSFELAVRAGLDARLALIAAYGYGLNAYTDSSSGLALVDSLNSAGCEVLSRSGHGHALARLLAHPQLFFWGDLDREGLRIALALRRRLPQLRLSALYEPMLCLIAQRRSSHPYVDLSGKLLQVPWTPTGEPLYDHLASSCRTRAVDQEAVVLRQGVRMAELAALPLELSLTQSEARPDLST
jgi:hypothetical protein